MSVACFCASPYCAVMGCQNAYRQRQEAISTGYTYVPPAITEERIREILREEIARAAAAPAPTPKENR